MASFEQVTIGSFACVPGDVELAPADIPDFDRTWQSVTAGADFDAMGCTTVRKMSSAVDQYVVDCMTQTLKQHGVSPGEVDHVVFSTTDAALGALGPDFVVRILDAAGTVNCVPMMVSYQQCCSAVTALSYGWQLFHDADVQNVLVVSVGVTPDDRERVRPFALFGDAVASCMISRRAPAAAGFRLLSSSIEVDYDGMVGRDSIASRRATAQASLAKLFRSTDITLADVARVFPANLFKPVTIFNAAMAGIDKATLHFERTLRDYGHCTSSDWMLNLLDYDASVGIEVGRPYVVQSSAPGMYASSLLVAVDGGDGQ